MCVIVDANLASRVFREPPDADFAPIFEWLRERAGVLVYGGRLASELEQGGNPRRRLRGLVRAGQAVLVSDEKVEAEEAAVAATGHCRSNDHHVVALARVSGARTLCTGDRDLQRDFRNPRLISAPRGSIYQREAHAHLLKHTTSCGRLPRKRR